MAEAVHIPAHLVPPWSPQPKQRCRLHWGRAVTGKKIVLCLHTWGPFDHVQLSVTLWTVACQAFLSGGSPGKNTRVYWTILVAIHILRQTLSKVGLRNGMKRPMTDRVYTVFKDIAVLRTTELGSCWKKWKRLPAGGDDHLALRSEERSSRETETYDAAGGDGLTWITSVLVNSAAPTNGWKICGLTRQFVSLHYGGQKFKINGLKSKASRPAFFSGTCREKPILSPFAAPREQVLCCWKRLCAMTRVFSWQNSVSLGPGLFVLQGQPCLLLQVSLDFLLLDSSSLWWKGHLFLVSSRRSCRSSQNLSALASSAYAVGA